MTTQEGSQLAAALARVQAKLPKISKSKTAKVEGKDGKRGFEYHYAGLADFQPEVLPLLAAEGLSWVTKPTLNDNGLFGLHYKLQHSSGEVDEGWYPLPDPSRSSAQQIGSAITYARRYSFTAVTGLVADEDDDGQAAQHAPKPQSTTRGKQVETVNLRPYLEKILNAEEQAALGEAWRADWNFKTTAVPKEMEPKARTLIDSYVGTKDPERPFTDEIDELRATGAADDVP